MIADLEQLVHALPASAQQPAPAGGGGNGDGGAATADDDEVVDAEFTRE
jgi:molecular chaperone DnaK